MKVAYVVPRYGLEVLGGAELGARMLAERLVSQLGWKAEIFTTCATDARTWADDYAPGTEEINGVLVNRFRSLAGRSKDFEKFSNKVLSSPAEATPTDQERWIDLQGPVCPDVIDAAAASDADAIVFYPYLYYPTVRGVPKVSERAIMHPAAHDEAPIRLPVFREIFGSVRGLVFQTLGERRLVEGLFATAHLPQIILGLGVEPGPGEPDQARIDLGLGDAPYLICLGRVDDGKGTGMLARFFARYKERAPGPLNLLFVGPVVDAPLSESHPDVVVAGPVDEKTKWGALRGAAALVSPSPFEAFSLALMEGWTAELPVLVNGHCIATREHVERSNGGLWFESYGEFEVALDRLIADQGLARQLGVGGAGYVDTWFKWPQIINRYGNFLNKTLGS